jgi:hypothetical protein
MNDIYIFHIYILIFHYIKQLYNIRVWLASRAEPSSSAREMAEPSRARSATKLHRVEPSRAWLGSFPARAAPAPWNRGLGEGRDGVGEKEQRAPSFIHERAALLGEEAREGGRHGC